jgi:hypothetical protein
MTKIPTIYCGNAETDGKDRRGWIVGSFIPEGIRSQENVEIKYALHSSGESRDDWVTGETRTTVCILLSGKFRINFHDKTTELIKPGDYVMWGAGIDHKWEAIEDSTVLTVRWTE